MPEDPEKKRLRKAKARARELLTTSNHIVIPLVYPIFDFLVIRKKEIRLITIATSDPSDHEKRAIAGFRCAEMCTKEVWIKRRNSDDFEIREIA